MAVGGVHNDNINARIRYFRWVDMDTRRTQTQGEHLGIVRAIEARDADLGIAAGNKRGHLFVKGQNVMVVPEDEMVDTLVEWAEYIHENGADAALEKAKATKDAARKAAQEDRDRNLGERGDDANESEAVIAEIRHGNG